jgi:hypothetical protein
MRLWGRYLLVRRLALADQHNPPSNINVTQIMTLAIIHKYAEELLLPFTFCGTGSYERNLVKKGSATAESHSNARVDRVSVIVYSSL